MRTPPDVRQEKEIQTHLLFLLFICYSSYIPPGQRGQLSTSDLGETPLISCPPPSLGQEALTGAAMDGMKALLLYRRSSGVRPYGFTLEMRAKDIQKAEVTKGIALRSPNTTLSSHKPMRLSTGQGSPFCAALRGKWR